MGRGGTAMIIPNHNNNLRIDQSIGIAIGITSMVVMMITIGGRGY